MQTSDLTQEALKQRIAEAIDAAVCPDFSDDPDWLLGEIGVNYEDMTRQFASELAAKLFEAQSRMKS